MPRTKISKNSKRNRDAAKEEKLREFDSALDQEIATLEMKVKQDIDDLIGEINMIKQRIPQKMLSITMNELLNLNITKFSEFHQITETPNSDRTNVSSVLQSTRKKSKDDEGYLTEDSTTGGIVNSTHLAALPRGRTPGPLSSAKAKGRGRRSRSACGYIGTSVKAKSSLSEHSSRSKLRTPMGTRPKAASADRMTPITPKFTSDNCTAILRWPKPGETVISMSGSPVVAHVMPDHFANVNIPIKNGVLSLRPKRMQSVDPDIIERIDPETLNQIKLLQSNLNIIMSYADKTYS